MNQLENKLSQWICNAADAMHLQLVTSSWVNPESKEDSSVTHKDKTHSKKESIFKPLYTYQVFGEEEKIFGYKNLKIKLFYASGSLETYLGIEYSAKLGDTEATKSLALVAPPQDIVSKLNEKLPRGYFDNYESFLHQVEKDSVSFKPLGSKLGEYSLPSDNDQQKVVYEFYKCSFETSGFKEYHRKLQLFLVWFIDGACFIEEDDDCWEIILLFEKRSIADKNIYSIIGYTTLYPFYFHPEQIRMRISQFFIMPPHQGKGHGAKLYSFVYNLLMNDKKVAQITVEDPNELFDDLRDRCDLKMLLRDKVLDGMKAPISKDLIREIGLKNLNKKHNFEYREFRLFVKRRLYIRNKEALETLDESERLSKLHETYEAVEDEYERLLESIRF